MCDAYSASNILITNWEDREMSEGEIGHGKAEVEENSRITI